MLNIQSVTEKSAAVKNITSPEDRLELERYEKVQVLIPALKEMAVEAASDGLDSFDLAILSYEAESLLHAIPFINPKKIEDYSSPAYQMLWKSIDDAGLEPYLKKNPTHGSEYAGPEEAYSKMVLAVRIPDTHPAGAIRKEAVAAMGFDPATTSDPVGEVERYEESRKLINALDALKDQAISKGCCEFQVTTLSYEVEPASALIPWVSPSRIDQYKSPSYQQLWKAIEDAGFEPFLAKNPIHGSPYAGAKEAFSKCILAARIPNVTE